MDTIEAAPDHVKDRQKPGGCERSSQTGIAPARIAAQDGHVSIATDVDGVKTLTCGTLAVVISRPKLPARWWPSLSSSTT